MSQLTGVCWLCVSPLVLAGPCWLVIYAAELCCQSSDKMLGVLCKLYSACQEWLCQRHWFVMLCLRLACPDKVCIGVVGKQAIPTGPAVPAQRRPRQVCCCDLSLGLVCEAPGSLDSALSRGMLYFSPALQQSRLVCICLQTVVACGGHLT